MKINFFQNEDDLKSADDLKNEGDLTNDDNLKNENNLKNKDDLKKKFAPPLKGILPEFFFDNLNSHRKTDVKPEMLSGVQTGNGTPHDKYNIRGIAHAQINRKDDIFRQRRLV